MDTLIEDVVAGGSCGVAGKASGRCDSSARLLWTLMAASGLKIHSHGGVEVVVAGAFGVAAKEDGSDSEGAVAGWDVVVGRVGLCGAHVVPVVGVR